MPGVASWSAQDRRMLAGVITETMIAMVGRIAEVDAEEEPAIIERTKRQLRLISLGVPSWRTEMIDSAVRHP